MRLRTSATALVAAALATTLLAGCRTNVGEAATIDGQRVTESQVDGYLTPKAQPVTSQTQSGGSLVIQPRTIVMTVLIKERLYRALLAKTPSGAPSSGEIQNLLAQAVQGKTYQQAAAQIGVKGYTTSFAEHLLTYAALGNLLNAQVQKGVNVDAIAAKLRFPVSVSPRYGSWDAKTFSLLPGATDGVPTFVTLQPTPAATGDAQAGASN